MATPGPEDSKDHEETPLVRKPSPHRMTQTSASMIDSMLESQQSHLFGMIPVLHATPKASDKDITDKHRPPPDDDHDEFAVVVYDEMTYKPEMLLNWSSIIPSSKTIWSSRHLWTTLGKLMLLSVAVGIIVVLAVPDPVSLKINIFYELSKFLNIFVGLMLGFFLSDSVQRWHHCARGFLELCDAIRNLQMQLSALGAPRERTDTLTRYGLLSGWLLMNHLEVEMNDPGGSIPDQVWSDMTTESDTDELSISPHLFPREAPTLKSVKDPAGAMWFWISSLIGRMSQDGEIPPMQSPTYGRIMNLAQDAHNGIRHVRSAISVRKPFVYVQMLATLTIMNNLMNAINLGIVLGIAASGAMIRRGFHYWDHEAIRVTGNQIERDFQMFGVTIVICFMGPVLYQALIEISVCLAQPFATKYGRMPIGRLLLCLEEDLLDGRASLEKLPKWSGACFKHQVPGK